ncbi:ABC transporter substrate-binding protein [Streptomyces sp. C10-9-1]|uniref:ABC transporter substrate-binding protein n=1 Tax=Streptomyces sp. C10-9-1 TaxID=1859285 RepID=UPI0021133949|nr:ABC transporter substrate-binding protein [Streptomyces sp. C10-9-1]MCQ6551851.1 ABC transporter substrate-binding protein [Streptomyces sp. C10-9-1]
MDQQTSGWRFADDRGRTASAPRTPERVVAYIRAGAALQDHGLRPVAVFGSAHDGPVADPAKAGSLPLGEVAYLGPGPALDAAAVLDRRPDLVVAVGYGPDQVYGLDPDAAKHLEEQVPLVLIDVGQDRTLDGLRDRTAALAASLGAAEPQARREEEAARRALRTAAERSGGARVLALSPAGAGTVHLARPGAWPDLRALADCGVRTAAPAPGPGVNWAPGDWSAVALLEPDVVLVDVRANAEPLVSLGDVPAWRALTARAAVVPWNPELPCSARAHADFFGAVAAALAARTP